MQENNPMTQEAERRRREVARARCSQLTSEMLLTEGMTDDSCTWMVSTFTLMAVLIVIVLIALAVFWYTRSNDYHCYSPDALAARCKAASFQPGVGASFRPGVSRSYGSYFY